jgi:hypothetical protein
VCLGNGDGTFAPLPAVGGFAKFTGFPFIADVNGDGRADLAEGIGLNILLGNGDGTFGTPIVVVPGTPLGGGPIALSITDLTGDERPDALLVVDVAPNELGLITLLNVSGPVTPDFSILASGVSPESIVAGATATSTVTLAPANGFSAAVMLSCGGLPAGASCRVAPESVLAAPACPRLR